MAKKEAVAAGPKKGKTAKPKKTGGKPAKQAAANDGGAAKIGHNSRVPTAKEVDGYFTRLDALHTQKREADARYMSDIKGVYEEASNKFGTSRKIMRQLYAKKNAEEAFAESLAEMEVKEREDMDRLILGAAKAFPPGSAKAPSFGAWLAAQVQTGELEAKDYDEVAPPPAEIVKTAAQAATEAMEAEDRAIRAEQTSH